MRPTDYTNYGLAQEIRRLPTHKPEIVAEVVRRLLEVPYASSLTSPAKVGGDPAEPRDDSDREYTKPVGYLPAYELTRLHSGHDAKLRSAKFGPSALDGDVPVYLQPAKVGGYAPTDDDIKRFALEHIAPHAKTFAPDKEYKETEQFRRIKAYTLALLGSHAAALSADGGSGGEK